MTTTATPPREESAPPLLAVDRHVGFLKTTALGGLVFLLPLIVIGALVGQVAPIVIGIAKSLSGVIPVDTPAGIALLVAIAIGVLVGLCFLAGLTARLSFGKRFSAWIERNVLLLFPRYAIVREQLADNVGHDSTQRLKPVLVTFEDHQRVGLESDRSGDVVAVYLPTSPDAWSGWVAYVSADRVSSLNMEFSEAVATCERMGRETVSAVRPTVTDTIGPET